MANVYQLTVFYSDAEKQFQDLAKIKPIVDKISEFSHPVEHGKQTTAYLFSSRLDREAIQNAFKPALAPKIHLLIVQVAAIVASNIPTHTVGQFQSLLEGRRIG